jgi:hypothetical protein
MTLREVLGADVQRVYEQVDALLNREDGLLMLFDGKRMVSYSQGFGVSPCQFELMGVELERAVRGVVVGGPPARRKDAGNRETRHDGSYRRGVVLQHLCRHDGRHHRDVIDRGGQGVA